MGVVPVTGASTRVAGARPSGVAWSAPLDPVAV
jgi:hypothetical protein